MVAQEMLKFGAREAFFALPLDCHGSRTDLGSFSTD